MSEPSEPPDLPSPLIQLELELEAAAKAAAETEKGILEYMRWEIAALEEREPPQWVRDYLDDRLAALMSAWRIKDDCTMILEAMKIGAVLRSPVICGAQKLLQRAKAAAAHKTQPEACILAIERLGLDIVTLRRITGANLANKLAADRQNFNKAGKPVFGMSRKTVSDAKKALLKRIQA
jgi:hypothetical protein